MTISKLIHCFDVLDKIFSVIFKERLAKLLLLQTLYKICENTSQWNPMFLNILCSEKHFTELISWEVLRKKNFPEKDTYERNDCYTARRIQNSIKHRRWMFFTERANSIQLLTIF